MTLAELARLEQVDDGEVVAWRYRRLRQSGYDVEGAILLASETAVDLHAATDLVGRGCPPALALRILI
jgi:hypothetical protein